MGSNQLTQLPDGFQLEDSDQKFNQAADFTFGQEGGYMVDKGRPTNYGVRQDILDQFNHENNYPAGSVADLTPDDARFVAKKAFFETPGFDKLPKDTATVLFDYGYNSGPRTAIKALQKTVGTNPDGSLGPKTVQATQKFINQNGEKALLQDIVDQRQQNYNRLLKDPINQKWQNGWQNRIKKLKDTFGLAFDTLTGTGQAQADQGPDSSAELPQGFQVEDQAAASSPSPSQGAGGAMTTGILPILEQQPPASVADAIKGNKPVLPDLSKLPDGFSLEDQLSQGKPPSLMDKIQNLFSKPPEQRQAEAANIYAISKSTGLDPLFVEKNYDKVSKDPKITGLSHEIDNAGQLALGAGAPFMAAGAIEAPIATAAGAAAFSLLDKVVDLNKFVPDNAADPIKKTVEAVDFIGKALATHGIFKTAPKLAEAFTQQKVTDFKLPQTLSLSGEQVKDIYQTGKLTTPEQVQLYSALNLSREQVKNALSQGVDINVPTAKIVTLTDKPWWSKVKGMFGAASEPTSTTTMAGAPTQDLPKLPAPETSGNTQKPPAIVEAEKHGTVVGIDAGTKLPIIDTSKPTSAPVLPATQKPVESPAIPLEAPTTEVPNGQDGTGGLGTIPSAQGQISEPARGNESSSVGGVDRTQEVGKSQIPEVSGQGKSAALETSGVDETRGGGEVKTLYHATSIDNLADIKKNGITQGVLTDNHNDAVDYAQMLNNRGIKNVTIVKVEAPIDSIQSKGIVNTVSGKRIGERFDVVKPILLKPEVPSVQKESLPISKASEGSKIATGEAPVQAIGTDGGGVSNETQASGQVERPKVLQELIRRKKVLTDAVSENPNILPHVKARIDQLDKLITREQKAVVKEPTQNNTEDYYAKIKSKLDSKSGQANLPGVQEAAAITKDVINYLSPRSFVPRQSLDTVMTEIGKRNKLEFELETSLSKITKFFDKQDPKDNVAFIDRIKLGQKQPTQELQNVADMMRQIEDIMHGEAKQFKPSLAYKDNHYRVLWKVIPSGKNAPATPKGGFKGVFRRPFQGSKGFTKQSTLSDMSEGINRGGVPHSYNPSVMWQNGLVDMQKFITANRMFKTLKDMNYVKFVKLGETPPDGFKKLDDRISTVYFPTPPGLVHAGNYYVEENTSRILNNFLSRDLIRESNLGKGLLALKNMTTSLELSLSPFHAAYTALTSVASEIGTGLQKMYNIGLLQKNPDAFLKGLTDTTLSVRSPYYLTRIGTNVIQMVREKGFLQTPIGQSFLKEFPDAKQLLDDLFTGGGKLAMHQDYKINSLRAFKEGLKNKEPWAVTLAALPAANEVIMKPLFEQFIPRLKIGNFFREYSQELVARVDQLASGKLTRPQLARQVWDSTENRFGEMNFDNLFWNRTFKSAMQLLFRSVTWKIGALKNISQGTAGQIGEIVDAIKGRHAPKLNRNTAYLLGLGMLIVAASEIIQRSNGQGGPKDLKDIMAPRYDSEGNRISLNTHLKDWVHIAHSPAGFIQNSLSGDIGKEFDIWNNKDFYGVKVYNEDDPIWKKELDKFKHRFPTPFTVSSINRLNQINAPGPLEVSTALGFTQPSPKYITNTKAEQLASDIVKQKMPIGGRTQKEADESQARFKLMEDYRKTGSLDDINKALESGKITSRQMNDIIKKSAQTPLERMTNHMSYEDVSRLIEVATPQELTSLIPIFNGKIDRKISAADFGDRADLKKIKSDLLNKYEK